MPAKIIIEEMEYFDNGFKTRVSFSEGEIFERVIPAFASLDLEWYFKEYIKSPFASSSKVSWYANQIIGYGEALFLLIFGEEEISECLAKYIETYSVNNIILQIIEKTANFRSIHWESLKNPVEIKPLAIRGMVIIRSILAPDKQSSSLEGSLNSLHNVNNVNTFNLLIVTSRPDLDDDLSYMTVQRPIIDALHTSNLPISPYILRPGTYQALVEHLNNTEFGFYQIVHFDLHGISLTYNAYEHHVEIGKFVKREEFQLPQLSLYDDTKAFVLFETGNKGVSLPIMARELAELLVGKGIFACTLNACDSCNEDVSQKESSFGRELVQNGVMFVTGMYYSISETAVKKFAEEFYTKFFGGSSLEKAVTHARAILFCNKERKATLDQTILLEDWILPVIYASNNYNLIKADEQSSSFRGWIAGLQPKSFSKNINNKIKKTANYKYVAPEIGFLGRDTDILLLEKWLLSSYCTVLVGMIGVGKTELLKYFGNYWYETNYIDNIFYFDFKDKYWGPDKVIEEIANYLLNETDKAEFDELGEFDEFKLEFLINNLSIRRTLVIFDSMELLNFRYLLSLPDTMKSVLIKYFIDLIKTLMEKCFVMIGARNMPGWLYNGIKNINLRYLNPLSEKESLNLANSILNFFDLKLTEILSKDLYVEHLIQELQGFPQLLKTIIPKLSDMSAKDILYEFQNIRTENSQNTFEVSLEFESSFLTEIVKAWYYFNDDEKELMMCFAQFQGRINFMGKSLLNHYLIPLTLSDLFKNLIFDKLHEVLYKVHKLGLAIYGEELEYLDLNPAFVYFLRKQIKRSSLSGGIEILESTYINYFQQLSLELSSLTSSGDVKKTNFAKIHSKNEYKNIFYATQLSIKYKQPILNFLDFFALYFNFKGILHEKEQFLNFINDKLRLRYCGTFPINNISDDELKDLVYLKYILADIFIAQYKYFEAETTLKEILVQLENLCDFNQWNCHIYNSLGISARGQKKYSESLDFFLKALDCAKEKVSPSMEGVILGELGQTHTEMKDFDNALNYYNDSLNFHLAAMDVFHAGEIYRKIGILYNERKDLKKSYEYYLKAAKIFEKFKSSDFLANTYMDIGIVLKDMKNYSLAREFNYKALNIFISSNDYFSQVIAYHNLANIEFFSQNIWESKEFFERALSILEYNNRNFTRNDLLRKAELYLNYCLVFVATQDYENLLKHAHLAEDIYLSLDFGEGLIKTKAIIGEYGVQILP